MLVADRNIASATHFLVDTLGYFEAVDHLLANLLLCERVVCATQFQLKAIYFVRDADLYENARISTERGVALRAWLDRFYVDAFLRELATLSNVQYSYFVQLRGNIVFTLCLQYCGNIALSPCERTY